MCETTLNQVLDPQPNNWVGSAAVLAHRTPGGMLSPTTSQLLQGLLAVGYVSSIYVHPNGRLKFKVTPQGRRTLIRTRNDPLVIRARLTAVVLATILSCVVVITTVFVTLPREEKVGCSMLRCTFNKANMLAVVDYAECFVPVLVLLWIEALICHTSNNTALFTYSSALQWAPVHLLPRIRSPFPTPILFQARHCPYLFGPTKLTKLHSGRLCISGLGCNFYVLQAPITEEVVFRACILAISMMAGASWRRMVFVSPLWFGVGR